MTTVHAYAAHQPGGPLQPFDYPLGPIGAHDTLDSRDEKALEQSSRRFDLLICTVDVKLDWNAYLQTLEPLGRLHLVGAVLESLDLNMMPMLFKQLTVSSSPGGSPETIRTMLDFASRHGILPVTEHFPLEQANEAIEHLRSGKARYRIVLDR